MEQVAVRVTNTGTRRFVDYWGNVRYVLDPGDTKIVPYHAMVYWAGDPIAVDQNNPSHPDWQYRTREIERLGVKYGTMNAAFWSEVPDEEVQILTVSRQNVEEFDAARMVNGRHPNLPVLEFINMETDEKYATVIDDPAGIRVAPPSQQKNPEIDVLRASMASMEAQMRAMQAELINKDPELSATDTDAIAATIGAQLDEDPQPDPTARATKDGPARRGRSVNAKADA